MPEQEPGHVVRTLRTLEAIARRPHSVAELALALDAHPRTVRRLLGRLVEEGYAQPDEARGTYVATLRVVALAGHVLERTDLVRMAFPFVARLRNETQEAAHFSVPAGDGVMHLIQETGESVVMVKPRLGEQVPFHCTAAGKALLAYLPERVEALVAAPLRRFTPHTLVEPADLLVDLVVVRERGYAVDEREHSLDLRCVAAPVRDHGGGVIGSIGISAPALRLAADDVPTVAAAVLAAATALSQVLGHDGPAPQPASAAHAGARPARRPGAA